MNVPSHASAFQVLLLQAADEGRGPILFGDSLARAREALQPFMVGNKFPNVYLEHPLKGDPFLDVTVLYNSIAPGTRIASKAATGAEALIDWFAGLPDMDDVGFGFELDTELEELPPAAIHFQPRTHAELVEPFCEAIGEPERAKLYLDLAARMPEGWPLSFFGLFRGRPNSPLRVCGYLDRGERDTCGGNPQHLRSVFDELGFTAYNDAMLEQVATLMAAGVHTIDFQFDVYPDGSLGNTFAIDLQFGIEQPESVQATFTDGVGAHVMKQLGSWEVADSRWQLGAQSAFARAIPVELDDGSIGRLAFTLMPQWVKARWTDGVLQPAKLYLYAAATLLGEGA